MLVYMPTFMCLYSFGYKNAFQTVWSSGPPSLTVSCSLRWNTEDHPVRSNWSRPVFVPTAENPLNRAIRSVCAVYLNLVGLWVYVCVCTRVCVFARVCLCVPHSNAFHP